MMKKTLIILAALAALCSCAKVEQEENISKDGMVTLGFDVTLPGRPTVTKALGDEEINSLTLAVFSSTGELVTTAAATPVSGTAFSKDGTDGKYHFKVTLPTTDGRTVVHFIAGAHGQINNAGSEAYVMSNLLTDAQSDGQGGYNLPNSYWQRIEVVDGINESTRFQDIVLIRNSVKLSLEVAQECTNFTITGFEVVNKPLSTHTALYVHNEFISEYQSKTYEQVKAIYDGDGWPMTRFDSRILSDVQADSGINGVVYDATSYQSSASQYIYQRSLTKNIDPTYIIVKGIYTPTGGQGVTCYYKINLADTDDHLLPLYRNFHYRFIIKSVGVKGEDTPYNAAQSHGSGGLNIGVVTHYDSAGSEGDVQLRLGWSQNTYTPSDYTSLTSVSNTTKLIDGVTYGVAYLPVDCRVSGTTNNQKIYLEDEDGNVFCVGTDSQHSVSTVVNDAYRSANYKVFHKAEIVGDHIELYIREPRSFTKQTFSVKVGGTGIGHSVTVYATGQLTFGIACEPQTIATGLNQNMTVNVQLPQDLSPSLFPMNLYIYVKNNSLSPIAGSDLVVGTGTAPGSSTGTYYFKKILSKDEYDRLSVVSGKVVLPLQFKTSKENSGSVVGVTSDKVSAAWTEFYNTSVAGAFSAVSFSGYDGVTPAAGVLLTLSFKTSQIASVDITLRGLEPANDYMTLLRTNDDGSKTYTIYSVTRNDGLSDSPHTIALRTTTDGNVSATLHAPNFTDATVSLNVAQPSQAQNLTVNVPFTSTSFSNNTFSDSASGLTVTLSKAAGASSYNMMNTYSNFIITKLYSSCDNIQFSTDSYPITSISFTLNKSELGISSTTGTMSNGAVASLTPSWSGSATSVKVETKEHGTDYEDKSNEVSSATVTVLKPALPLRYEQQ